MAHPRLTTVRAGHTEQPTRRPGETSWCSGFLTCGPALERQLRFRRDQLAELEAGEHTRGSGSANPPDRRNEEAVYGLHEVDALVLAGARRALADIELALVRMRTGRYGYCRSCGARIPLVVLEGGSADDVVSSVPAAGMTRGGPSVSARNNHACRRSSSSFRQPGSVAMLVAGGRRCMTSGGTCRSG